MASFRGTSLLIILALLAVPFVWDSFTAYQLGLYLLYGMVAQGIALCWGRTGFLPLGQALFFGIGAYLAGYFLKLDAGWTGYILGVLVAIAVPAMFAALVGVLVFARQTGSGPYFSLITLALAMLGFQMANSMEWLTGGFNGMTGIPGLPGIDTYSHLYYVIIVAVLATTLFLSRITRSPFGLLLVAIRENEERVRFFGYRAHWLKAAAFGISAGIAGFAGALYAPHQGLVTPQSVGFLLSAEFVIWTAVGGRFGLLGPLAGAVAIGFLASGLRDTFRYWEIVVALVFIIVVLRLPSGAGGLVADLMQKTGLVGRKKTKVERDIIFKDDVAERDVDLELDDVRVTVGPVRILQGASFSITKPGIHCLIGPNGAGKTSVFNVMTGKLPLSSGRIAWQGSTSFHRFPHLAARHGIGRKLQVPSIFPALTVAENLNIALWAGRIGHYELLSMIPYAWTTRLMPELVASFPILENDEQEAAMLSVGERQMLDFAMTILPDPDLVLLDEPCAGLSSDETAVMIDAIEDMAKETQSAFLVIEHDMQLVEKLAESVFVMHQGRLLAEGTMEEIRQNPEVQAVYSGGSK